MPQASLVRRVEILEPRVEGLERLPVRMDALQFRMDALESCMGALELQIVQFREEVGVEFSAVRQEMVGQGAALRNELRAEIRGGDEETRRYMRVLHEDVISRIALIQEGRHPRKR